jgi:hypothetical protein
MFPPYEENWFRKVSAELCYQQHGGSGFSFTLADIERLDLDDIEYYLDWLDERRSDEAERIKKAGRG